MSNLKTGLRPANSKISLASQNQNIILLCKLFTQLYAPSGQVSNPNAQPYSPVNLDTKEGTSSSSPIETPEEQEQLEYLPRNISNLKAPNAYKNYGPSSHLQSKVWPKKYALVQTLLNNMGKAQTIPAELGYLSLHDNNNWKNSIYGTSKKAAISGSSSPAAISYKLRLQESPNRKSFLTYWLLPFISLLPLLDTTQARNMSRFLGRGDNYNTTQGSTDLKLSYGEESAKDPRALNPISGFVLVNNSFMVGAKPQPCTQNMDAIINDIKTLEHLKTQNQTYSAAYNPIRYYLDYLFSKRIVHSYGLGSGLGSKEPKQAQITNHKINNSGSVEYSRDLPYGSSGNIQHRLEMTREAMLDSLVPSSLKAEFAFSQMEFKKSQLNFYWENPYIQTNSLQIHDLGLVPNHTWAEPVIAFAPSGANSSFALKTESLEFTRVSTKDSNSRIIRTPLAQYASSNFGGTSLSSPQAKSGQKVFLAYDAIGNSSGTKTLTHKPTYGQSPLRNFKGFKVAAQIDKLTSSQAASLGLEPTSRFIKGIFNPYGPEGLTKFRNAVDLPESATTPENYKDLNIKLDHLIKRLNWAIIPKNISTSYGYSLGPSNTVIFDSIMEPLTAIFSENSDYGLGRKPQIMAKKDPQTSKVEIVKPITWPEFIAAKSAPLTKSPSNPHAPVELMVWGLNAKPYQRSFMKPYGPLRGHIKPEAQLNSDISLPDAAWGLKAPSQNMQKVVKRAFDSKLDSTFILLANQSRSNLGSLDAKQLPAFSQIESLGENQIAPKKFVKLRTPILSSSSFISNSSLWRRSMGLAHSPFGAYNRISSLNTTKLNYEAENMAAAQENVGHGENKASIYGLEAPTALPGRKGHKSLFDYVPLSGTYMSPEAPDKQALHADLQGFVKKQIRNSTGVACCQASNNQLLELKTIPSYQNYLKFIKSQLSLILNSWRNFQTSPKYISARGSIMARGVSPKSLGPKGQLIQNTILVNNSKTGLFWRFSPKIAKKSITPFFISYGSFGALPRLKAKSINLILNHKKFCISWAKSAQTTPNKPIQTMHAAEAIGSNLAPLTTNYGESLGYFRQKKEIQKKRKAKKLRLESRRQKKRKRFYPRPHWLRLNLKMDNQIRSKGPFLSGLWSLDPKQAKAGRALSKQTKASVPYSIKAHYGQSPSLLKARGALSLSGQAVGSSVPGGLTGHNQKWVNCINLTTYNKFLYNIAMPKTSASWLTAEKQNPQGSYQPDTPVDKSKNQKSSNSLESIRDLRNGPRNSKKLGPLTSKYKLENTRIAEFSYRQKFELTSKKLAKIKMESNYVNFEPKTANQTIPKKETNSSFYRDFWLWLYNTTATNSYNKAILLDNFLTHVSVPLKISTSYGAEPQSNNFLLNSAYNQKAFKIVPWAINKTNLWTTTNKRLNLWSRQKLRNQSKNNKTKWLQKQLQTKINNWLSPSIAGYAKGADRPIGLSAPSHGNLGSIAPKLLFKIRQKIHQKDQKLAYLVNFGKGEPFVTSFENTNKWSPNSARSSILYPTTLSTVYDSALVGRSSGLKTQTTPFGSSAGLNSKASLNLAWWSGLGSFEAERLSGYSTPNQKEASPLVDLLSPQTLAASLEQKQVNKTMWFGLLFHFCALISLVSISQIRCFIKFHLILLHKLSNTYLSILYSISNNIYGNLKNLGFLGNGLFSDNAPTHRAKFKNDLWRHISKSKLRPVGPYTPPSGKLLDGPISKSRIFMSSAALSKGAVANQVFKTYGENSQFSSPTQQLSIRILLENLGISRQRGYKSRQGAKEQVGLRPYAPEGLVLKDKPLLRLYLKSFTILGLSKQIELIELARILSNNTKKTVLNSGFKVIDSFESCLRLIYGFFEKPAEFTMDWIAYAFLVEWSSDLLSFTPQKNETQNWLAFSKIIRQNQLGFMLYGLQGAAGLKSFNSNTAGLVAPLNSFVPTVLLTQFISKRFFYLNDQFLSILYKPDTDLLMRQKKGTLFWDIWSDFLIKAADKYNINVPSLSNIKEEQNLLLENFLADSTPSTKQKLAYGHQSQPSNKVGSSQSRLWHYLGLGDKKGFSLEPKASYTPDIFLKAPKNSFKAFGPPKQKYYTPAMGKSPVWFDSLAPNQESDYGYGQDNLAQQFVTYQSKETELFLDYNTPKSFNNLSAIQYYSLIQQPIGTIVCQIYSGILTKQVAKNILVIGSTLSSNSSSYGNLNSASRLENNQKTLLIQALAGETEIQMITDNASRYAIVNRGFAVGIKYLKEVFDAITLNTPCLFLLEDIHLIGERRPQLISDHGDAGGSADSMNKSVDAAFGSQRSGEAVHEKNQIYYQLSRHAITHYKKPFKGDFSLAIPTNHFSFDLFLKSRPNSIADGPGGALTHPLWSPSGAGASGINIFDLDQTTDKGQGSFQAPNLSTKLISKRKLNFDTSGGLAQTKLSSSQLLKLGNNKLLAPPSTSPFSVLLLKEQKKLKATKIVKEIPWVGLPTEQLSLLPRVSYSVRAKVSALAEFGLTNMSAKLDMITDLLVIIDSVRSHRGFVVFATTHLPHLLDPALRRPGRLDETISIPTIANLWTRWEFSKSSTASTNLNAVGAHGWGLSPNHTFGNHYREAPMFGKIHSSPLNNYTTNSLTGHAGTYNLMDFSTLDFASHVNNNFFSPIVHGFKQITHMRSSSSYQEMLATGPGFPVKHWRISQTDGYAPKGQQQDMPQSGDLGRRFGDGPSGHKTNTPLSGPMGHNPETSLLTTLIEPQASWTNKFSKKYTTKVSRIAYYQMGKKLITNKYVFKLSNSTPIYLNPSTNDSTTSLTEMNELLLNYGPEAFKYKSLYSSPRNVSSVLIGLMSGKLSEIFAFENHGLGKAQAVVNFGANKPFTAPQNITGNFEGALRSLYGIDETWRAATSFAFSFIQKRYLFNKNLIVPKLLNFLNYGALEEAPSPPSSNILIPAKRYENYKKTLKENIQFKMYGLTTSNLQSKLQNHMKQAFIRNIYAEQSRNNGFDGSSGHKQKVQEEFLNTANNSLLKLAGIDLNKNLFIQLTSASSYYENKIYNRHRLALNNQWWNSQLTEHSAETLFLSDIDWRFTFIDNSALRKNTKELLNFDGPKGYKATDPLVQNSGQGSSAASGPISDILIDFPDADQHYNPKQRRWTITSGYWNTWFNVDKNLHNEIFDSLILESVMVVYTLLNSNREVLDYSASKFMKKGLIKELEVKNFLIGDFD